MKPLIDIINTDNERNIIEEICDNDLAKVKNTYGGKRKGADVEEAMYQVALEFIRLYDKHNKTLGL